MPKVIKNGKIVDEESVALPEGLSADLQDPTTIKTLTTTDENGVPHTVHKHSMMLTEDGCLAYIEFLEGSQTSKNMLKNHWSKNFVGVTSYNPGNGNSFQIKGIAYKYLVEGPIWEKMLKMTWEMFPTIEPCGVWLIIPKDVRDETYEGRFSEEDERLRPSHHQWFAYKDASYGRRHKK